MRLDWEGGGGFRYGGRREEIVWDERDGWVQINCFDEQLVYYEIWLWIWETGNGKWEKLA
jgi:hypothetical protein